ncbi:MAG TPA: hypothetical protein VK741_08985 [Acetobacteraceae bacterium]|nr:hypothetical protein [Acetobacteraceae bacterium]
MMTRFTAATLLALAVAWPAAAGAVEFPQQAGPPPLWQSPSGFVGVPGPEAWSPEHFQAFPPPPSMRVQIPACTNCPAPTQPAANQSAR